MQNVENTTKTVCMLVHNIYMNDSRVKRCAISLVHFGYDVHVFAFWPNCDNEIFTDNNVKVYQYSLKNMSGKKRFAEMMWKAKKTVLSINIEAAIIHAHDLDTLLPAFYLSKKFNAKLIYDSHEWYTGSVHLVNKKKETIIWSILEKLLIPHCNQIITVNNSIAALFNEKYNLQGNVHVLRNFDNMPIFDANISEDLNNKIYSFKKKFTHTIIYGGYIQKGRGLSLLIKSLKKIPSVGLIIAGDGAFMNELKNEIAAMGLGTQVLMTGMLPMNELYFCYKSADIGYCYYEPLSKNHKLSLPNKLSQYIQSGLAVIASDSVEIASLIHQYNVGLVVKNEKEMKTTISELIKNLGVYKATSLNYATHFSWEKESEKLKQIYNLL